MIINMIQEFCRDLLLINCLVKCQIFHLKILFPRTFNSEFLHIEVWFTDQNSKPLEIEDKINITLVIN